MEQIFIFVAFLVSIVVGVFVVPTLTANGASPALIRTVSEVATLAVCWAERTYKMSLKEGMKYDGSPINRKRIAMDKVNAELIRMKIDPGPLRELIDWLIEAAVEQLPKTHLDTD